MEQPVVRSVGNYHITIAFDRTGSFIARFHVCLWRTQPAVLLDSTRCDNLAKARAQAVAYRDQAMTATKGQVGW